MRHLTRRLPVSILVAALLFVASLSAGGLDIEGRFQLGNMGFTPTRAGTDATYKGTDYFADGDVSLRQDLPGGIRIEAAAERDLVTGYAVWAAVQYRSDYFRVALGPYIGLAGSLPNILKPGVSALLGLQLPGIAFLTLRTDNAQGGQAADTYIAQNSAISLGFYVRDSAICSFGVSYDQLSSVPNGTELVDSLTAYTFNVEVFEKNVPYRLDFNFAYQVLLRQYLDGAANPSHGLNSVVVGIGVDVIVTPSAALLLGFRTSVWTLGTGVLSNLSDIGFAPFLFQASAGFRVTLGAAAADSAGL